MPMTSTSLPDISLKLEQDALGGYTLLWSAYKKPWKTPQAVKELKALWRKEQIALKKAEVERLASLAQRKQDFLKAHQDLKVCGCAFTKNDIKNLPSAKLVCICGHHYNEHSLGFDGPCCTGFGSCACNHFIPLWRVDQTGEVWVVTTVPISEPTIKPSLEPESLAPKGCTCPACIPQDDPLEPYEPEEDYDPPDYDDPSYEEDLDPSEPL